MGLISLFQHWYELEVAVGSFMKLLFADAFVEGHYLCFFAYGYHHTSADG